MKQIKELKALYEAEQLRIGHPAIPVPGYYKFQAKEQILFSGKLPVIAFAIWKPLSGTKADKGHQVQVPLLPLILSDGPPEDRKILVSGDIVGYVLVIQDVSTRTNPNLLYDLVVDWKLKRLPKCVTVEEMNALLNGSDGDKLIDGFLSENNNLLLFNDDEPEDEIDNIVEDDYDLDMEFHDDDDQ